MDLGLSADDIREDPADPDRKMWLTTVVPAVYAIVHDQEERLGALLEAGLDPNTHDGAYPLLLLAVRQGAEKCAALLLEHGADPDACHRRNRRSSLLEAAAHGQRQIVQRLLLLGAAAGSASLYGTTPLIVATQHGHDDIVGDLRGWRGK